MKPESAVQVTDKVRFLVLYLIFDIPTHLRQIKHFFGAHISETDFLDLNFQGGNSEILDMYETNENTILQSKYNVFLIYEIEQVKI